MYVIKNALKCISRAKGRSVLIGIIALVIATSACLGLSIRQAAENAKQTTLESMSVTAQISFDRQSVMQNLQPPQENEDGKNGFDRDKFSEIMGGTSALSLEEYEKYAKADTVYDFYYTQTAYFNGSDNLEAVTDETEEDDDNTQNQMPGGFGGFQMPDRGGMKGGMMSGLSADGDFTVIGYSSDSAMSDFVNNTSSITSGTVFKEGTETLDCIISEELATFNSISVGDSITVTNSANDDETYNLLVVGIYTSTENNDFTMSMFGSNQDPANKIYMSANALQKIIDASEDINTDDESSPIKASLSATYSFADVDSYYQFEEDVRSLGLDDSYTVSSADLTSFENSLTPLNTLSSMAGWFLLVILIIGAVILVVLNIFNVRERKYEIGVLTAMGMKKGKVALQFVCEILVITMIAVIIGAGIGAVSSVPVTNALLENQTQSQSESIQQLENNFGRPGNMNGSGLQTPPDMPQNDGGGFGGKIEQMFSGASDYITEVDSAMNLTVVFQMLLIGLGLTLVASGVSVMFVMRYDPLKIFANRD
ncbi:MAG: ABC transporter permease [Clostridia bacterium]|nr:ABC transporter permease [Clostridia bacterium]